MKKKLKKEQSKNDCKSAFVWGDLDNRQRKKVVEKFEEMFGPDFAEKADFGNKYVKRPVKPGQLLSRKIKFDQDSLGYYCDQLLDNIFTVLTYRDLELYAEKIVPKTLTEDTKLFWLSFLGSDDCGNYFYDKDECDKQIEEDNRLFSNINRLTGKETTATEITVPAGTVIYELYRFNNGEWNLDREYPAFKTIREAQDRAAHNLQFMASLFVRWETWDAAGYAHPEKGGLNSMAYDYTKENVFKFDKKQLLEGVHFEYAFMETTYFDRLKDPEINYEFIEWCRENL